MELTIQLAIIMIGKQTFESIIEMVLPFLMKLYNNFKISTGIEKQSSEEVIGCNQWTEDYKLLDFENCSLFLEYLEMSKKKSFGFCFLFFLII